MKSITQNNRQMKSINDKFLDFSQQYQLGNILRAANTRKRTGFPALQIFLLVISTVFQHGSLYMQMHLHPEFFSFGKDKVYRFMNSCHINWRRFTTLLASRIISQTIVPLTSDARKNVFIIDDSLFSRSRSKKVELLAKVFDHAHHVYTYGFRMLVGRQYVSACQLLPAFYGECQKPYLRSIQSHRSAYKRRASAQAGAAESDSGRAAVAG